MNDLPFLCLWHYYLHVYNKRPIQTFGLTSLFDDFNKSNLTLCTVLEWSVPYITDKGQI